MHTTVRVISLTLVIIILGIQDGTQETLLFNYYMPRIQGTPAHIPTCTVSSGHLSYMRAHTKQQGAKAEQKYVHKD